MERPVAAAPFSKGLSIGEILSAPGRAEIIELDLTVSFHILFINGRFKLNNRRRAVLNSWGQVRFFKESTSTFCPGPVSISKFPFWKMEEKLDCELKSDLQSLARLTDGIEDLMRRHGIPPKVYNDVLIAVDEIYSNIIIHGYKNDPSGSIRVSATLDDKKFEITFFDEGVMYEPRRETPKLGKDLLAGDYPGLGLFITRSIMDEFHYERVQGENRTRLVKNIPANSGISA